MLMYLIFAYAECILTFGIPRSRVYILVCQAIAKTVSALGLMVKVFSERKFALLT